MRYVQIHRPVAVFDGGGFPQEAFPQLVEAMLGVVAQGLLVVDAGHIVRIANSKAEQVWGYAAGELQGVHLCQLMPPQYRDMHLRGMERYLRTRQTLMLNRPVQVEGLRLDGGTFPLELRATAIEYGGDLYFVTTARDLTEQLEVERELARANEALEETVQARTADLYTAQLHLSKSIVELQRANEELAQLTYVASHDLQEPLRTIGSYTQLIERKLGQHADHDTSEYLGFVMQATRRMKKMIQDMLQFSRLGQRELQYTEVDLRELATEALYHATEGSMPAHIRFSIAELPVVRGSALELQLLLYHLFSNAIKFNRQQSVVHVAVSAQRLPHAWQITVSDDGVGISPEHHDLVFQAFKRVQHVDAESLGIGLAICRKVVHRHGGSIWLSPDGARGTTVHFTLPC